MTRGRHTFGSVSCLNHGACYGEEFWSFSLVSWERLWCWSYVLYYSLLVHDSCAVPIYTINAEGLQGFPRGCCRRQTCDGPVVVSWVDDPGKVAIGFWWNLLSYRQTIAHDPRKGSFLSILPSTLSDVRVCFGSFVLCHTWHVGNCSQCWRWVLVWGPRTWLHPRTRRGSCFSLRHNSNF